MSTSQHQRQDQTTKIIDESSTDTNQGFPCQDIDKINCLNSNIDDLFSKIMKLTSQVQKDISPELQLLPPIDLSTNFNTNFKSYEPKPLEKKQIDQVNEKESKQVPIKESLSMKHFQLGKQIGQGKFGIVYECKHIPTGMIVALKKIYRSSIQDYGIEGQIQNQVTILSEISHPNIIKLYGFFGDPYHFFIITEYLPGKSLEKMLKADIEVVKDILFQLCTAIKYLHDLKIIHRDIKAQNIIYQNGVVKLLDFGYATYLTQQPINTLCGTLDYVSPQVLEKQAYGREIDLWALGILTYQLLTGTVPYKTSTIQVKKQLIKSQQIQFGELISQQARSFIQSLLKKNPKERLSADNCLQHPFIRNRNLKSIEIQDPFV